MCVWIRININKYTYTDGPSDPLQQVFTLQYLIHDIVLLILATILFDKHSCHLFMFSRPWIFSVQRINLLFLVWLCMCSALGVCICCVMYRYVVYLVWNIMQKRIIGLSYMVHLYSHYCSFLLKPLNFHKEIQSKIRFDCVEFGLL